MSNYVTGYDGTRIQVPAGVKLLEQVPRFEQGACCVCGEVLQKAQAEQRQCGKKECRDRYNAWSRRQSRAKSRGNEATEAAYVTRPEVDSALRAPELAKLRSALRSLGCQLGGRDARTRCYAVTLQSGRQANLSYMQAREFTTLQDWVMQKVSEEGGTCGNC